MKHLKKAAALLLALMMVLSMALTVSAAGPEGPLTGGTININNAVNGQTYSAYQLLYLESYNAVSGAYSYKANSEWADWLKTQTSYVSIDSDGYVTWVENADPAAFAKLAQQQLPGKTAAGTQNAAGSTVTFSNLKLGYYLVDTTLGTLCSLDTTNPTAIIQEKNQAPSNEKTVQEDSTSNYGAENDADIAQEVNFQSTITARPGAENYVFHDSMSAGLTYKGVTGVTLNGKTVDASSYTVNDSSLSDGCTFEIHFTQTFCDTLKADDKIVISYNATLNEDAKIGLEGNPNQSQISYGDSNKTTTTPPSITKTYTWDLKILKYGNGNKNNVLANAQFVLLNKDKTKVAAVTGGKITGWKNVPTATGTDTITWPDDTILTTDTKGEIHIQGLDADTYYLREVKAPDGYNVLKDDREIHITGKTYDTTAQKDTYTTVVEEIDNKSGISLPETGGMGTTLFYILGAALVVIAVVLLVTGKRMRSED